MPEEALQQEPAQAIHYRDFAADRQGYLFLLYDLGDADRPEQYRLAVLRLDVSFVFARTGVTAARCTLDFWRNLYTLNYASQAGPGGRLAPTVSLWVPLPPWVSLICGGG